VSDFDGLHVIVVGANGALGGALATAFASAGATAIGLDREIPKPDRQIADVDYR
jgi:NAD(P)-dependent dehydrogenase (short-subunit alcohol dehydrogenase family)